METVKTVTWIICGVIWGIVILGTVGLIIVNRIRNRKREDKD